MTVYLRGLLLVAAGGVLIESNASLVGFGPLILLVFLALTNIALLAAPVRLVGSRRFGLALGGMDLLVVGLTVYLAGTNMLAVSVLVMALVIALASERAHTFMGAAVVCTLHAWFILGAGFEPARHLAPQVLFLYSIALYYGYLAGSLHDTRRREDAGRLKRRELTALLEILETVTSSLDLHRMTNTVVQKVSTLIPAARCSVVFVDKKNDRGFVTASNHDPEINMLEIDLKRYPEIRQAIAARKPVLIRDVLHDPLMAEVRGVLEEMDVQSIMVIPIVFGEEFLGTLCLRAAWTSRQFHQADIDFCTAVAGVCANALKNALLHRQVNEESRRYREVNEQLNRIFDSSPDLIVTTDEEGRITGLNRAAETLLGQPAQAIVGKHCTDFFERVPTTGLIESASASRASWNHSCTVTRNDGLQSSLQLNMSIMRDDAGAAMGIVLLGRDMTELENTHAQLLQANKVSTIGEVVSHVARELSGPLSGVMGFTQMLLARPASGPLKRELEKILDAGLRCQKTVKNLLFFARRHRPERKYLDINEIIDRTIDLGKYQLHLNNIEMVQDLDPDLPRTMFDRHQMQQVFLNLMNNAQHAMVATGQRGLLRIRTSFADETVRIEFSDNGRSMDDETLERVFDPLFKLKQQDHWAGLGLSASHGIVKEHGGRLQARSVEGEGTTFVIELPIRESEAEGPSLSSENMARAEIEPELLQETGELEGSVPGHG